MTAKPASRRARMRARRTSSVWSLVTPKRMERCAERGVMESS